MLWFDTLQSLRPTSRDPSAAGRHDGSRAIKLTGTSRFCMWLVDTAQRERRYGLVVALGLIRQHNNLLQLTVGWCWQRDPDLRLKPISSQCGGGRAWQWKTLCTDGPLKKPTAAKQCSGWAVWDAEAIMGFNCSPHGNYSNSEGWGQINQIVFLFLPSTCCFPNIKKHPSKG